MHRIPCLRAAVLATAMSTPIARIHTTEKHSQLRKRVDDLLEQFAEARLLISEAEESVGTVYFTDDANDAADATNQCLQSWEELRVSLGDEAAILDSINKQHEMKFKQLREELVVLLEKADD